MDSRYSEAGETVRHRSRFLSTLVAFVLVATVTASAANAGINADTEGDGVGTVGLSPSARLAIKARQAELIALDGPRYEFKLTISGCDVGGGAGANSICLDEAIQTCANNRPEYGLGPLTDVRRRMTDKAGAVMLNGKVATPAEIAAAPDDGWEFLGNTCFPQDLPGSAPIPSVEMIIRAFHLTPWSEAGISTQPKGDVTLVNLKTFYQVGWSASGFEPGEVDALDPATMFGFKVDVRPKLMGFVYHFGDGASEGPTTSTGGVYPNGDIVHTYREPGTYQTNVTATFGADFRINGGAWLNLPSTVVVQQPATRVTVREAKAVLVQQ